jgi:hypothetical protein
MAVAQITPAGGIEQLACVVASAFREMPGLRLTRAQVCRLWNFSSDEAALVLKRLIDSGVLITDASGQYCCSRRS